MNNFESDARKFGWGTLVNNFPYDIVGGVQSVLRNFPEVKLDDMKNQARVTQGYPVIAFDEDLSADLISTTIDLTNADPDIIRFHPHVRTWMIAKRIESSLKEDYLKTLMLKKYDFT